MENMYPQPNNKTLLMKDYIASFKGAKLSFSKLYFDKEKTVHMIDLFDNFLNDYYAENTEIISFTDVEKDKYRYSPILLSQDLFKTPDLWRILLKCNNLVHPGEMELEKNFRVPKIDALTTFFNKYEVLKQNLGGEWRDLKDIDIVNL